MTNAATSLDRLHDLALPPEVSWWPLAPGWYVLSGIGLLLAFFVVHRGWKNWQADAYRRAALRELASLEDATAIAELLRRTALVIAPRSMIAGKTGVAWLDWLAAQSNEAMPAGVREHLTAGVYSRPTSARDITLLRNFAARWIKDHHRPLTTDH